MVNIIIKHTTNERRTMTTKICPPAPSSTPFPEDTSEYHGWYSEAQQRLRVLHPSRHKFNGKIIVSPPYMYWTQGDQKVLVTEVTHTSIATPRQVANGDIYLGRVDKYWGRSYTRLSANVLKTDGSADHSPTLGRPPDQPPPTCPWTKTWRFSLPIVTRPVPL